MIDGGESGEEVAPHRVLPVRREPGAAWFQFFTNTDTDVRFRRFARILEISTSHALGIVTCLWKWTALQAPLGCLDGYTPEEIGEMADGGGGSNINPIAVHNALVLAGFIEHGKTLDGRTVAFVIGFPDMVIQLYSERYRQEQRRAGVNITRATAREVLRSQRDLGLVPGRYRENTGRVRYDSGTVPATNSTNKQYKQYKQYKPARTGEIATAITPTRADDPIMEFVREHERFCRIKDPIKFVASVSKRFPEIDLLETLRKIDLWTVKRPERSAKVRDWRRFIINWLAKDREDAEGERKAEAIRARRASDVRRQTLAPRPPPIPDTPMLLNAYLSWVKNLPGANDAMPMWTRMAREGKIPGVSIS